MKPSPTAKIGKGNSLLYALIVAAFLTWNTVDLQYNKREGWSFRSKNPPIEIVTPSFVLMGVGLGINLTGIFKTISDLATIVSRNSAAISTIATKTNTELPIEKPPLETPQDSEKDGDSAL